MPVEVLPSQVRSPQEILTLGLDFFNGLPDDFSGEWTSKETDAFRSVYGQHPLVLSYQWYDLCCRDLDDDGLTQREKTNKGLKMFFVAHHFVWAYPKNLQILGAAFNIRPKRLEGEFLWRWMRKIASLKREKIVWPEAIYENAESQIFIVSVDGTDFKCWERKHPTLPLDKGQYTHKYNHGGLKYEIAIDIFTGRAVWINGPFRGGLHDKTIFVDHGLADKIPQGKLVVTDRVYGAKAHPQDHLKMALPNPTDELELANFKSRVRLRHETFNGRLKMYKSLSDTFQHSEAKHKLAFEVVCVTVQYAIDNGFPLFQV